MEQVIFKALKQASWFLPVQHSLAIVLDGLHFPWKSHIHHITIHIIWNSTEKKKKKIMSGLGYLCWILPIHPLYPFLSLSNKY